MKFDRLDRNITGWTAQYGIFIMRLGLGLVFFWFGALKLVPGLSPAEELVRNTIYFVDPDLFLLIGAGLVLAGTVRGGRLDPEPQREKS
jgi:hypothetical protein